VINLPTDCTPDERKIVDFAYAHVYRIIPDPLDKFIVAFMFDMQNSVQATAVATGMTRKTIWERHKRIKKFLEDLKIKKEYFKE
jgi:hypothetical protein